MKKTYLKPIYGIIVLDRDALCNGSNETPEIPLTNSLDI